MRLRIPLQTVRATAVLAVLAFFVAPVTLTLVSARETKFEMLDLSRLARFVLPFSESAEPAKTALRGNPPAIDPGTLSGGNIGREASAVVPESLSDLIAGDSLAKIAPALSPEELAAASYNLGADVVADSSNLPLAATANPRLQERYLWRAWLDDAARFHARRTGGQPLMVYQPGEGYAVLQAAYQPMIQPVDPRYRPQEDRAIYQDRRPRRSAPGEEDPEAESSERARTRTEKGSGGLAGLGINGFQPWDSQVMTDPFGPANALVSRVPGLRIERVVLFQGFSSNSYPMGQRNLPFINTNLGYDLDVGALATISWSRARPTSAFFMSYTPSHVRRMNFSEWNTTDHQLTMGARKNYSRLNLSVSNNTAVRGLNQVLFTPAVVRGVPNAPSSFEDLVASAQGGQLSSEEIASVLTGAPVVESQPRTEFGQGRVLSTTLSANASYSHSARLSSTVGVSGNHFQSLSNPVSDDRVIGQRGLFRSTSVGGNAGINYKLSPETSVGVNSTVRRNYSSFRDSTSVNTSASVNRRVGRRWSVNAGAGVGTVSGENPYDSVTLGPSSRRTSTWIVNGGANYSGRHHNFGIHGSRSAGDAVGLGARVSHQAGVNWNWGRPGSPWGLHGQASWYQMSIQGIPGNAQGGFGGLGLVRRLTRETSFQVDYSYQTFQSPFRGVVSNLSGHRLQMSWMWRPSGPPR